MPNSLKPDIKPKPRFFLTPRCSDLKSEQAAGICVSKHKRYVFSLTFKKFMLYYILSFIRGQTPGNRGTQNFTREGYRIHVPEEADSEPVRCGCIYNKFEHKKFIYNSIYYMGTDLFFRLVPIFVCGKAS